MQRSEVLLMSGELLVLCMCVCVCALMLHHAMWKEDVWQLLLLYIVIKFQLCTLIKYMHHGSTDYIYSLPLSEYCDKLIILILFIYTDIIL